MIWVALFVASCLLVGFSAAVVVISQGFWLAVFIGIFDSVVAVGIAMLCVEGWRHARDRDRLVRAESDILRIWRLRFNTWDVMRRYRP